MTKKFEKEITRTVVLTEVEWKWLTGWFEQLFGEIPMDDLNPDILRMGGIVRKIKAAESNSDRNKKVDNDKK